TRSKRDWSSDVCSSDLFLGDVLFATGREVMVWSLAALCGAFFIPLIMSANRAIWQTHVPLAVQGRVFAVQGMLQQLSMPVGYLRSEERRVGQECRAGSV